MNVSNRFAAVLSVFLFSAQAHAVEFSLTSGALTPAAWGNTYSATAGALTLTASAWSSTGKHGAFETAALGLYGDAGLGVCNRDEGIQCVDNKLSHALDNKGADDLILFSFSRATQLTSLTLAQFGGDSDLSLWAGTGPINLDGMLPGALGSASLINNASSAGTIKRVALDSAFSGSYSWFAVAARLDQADDFAMLRALTVEVPSVSMPVPEAETWTLLLAGLGLVWFAVRRRI